MGWGDSWSSTPWGGTAEIQGISLVPLPSTMWEEVRGVMLRPQDVVHDRIWSGGDSHPYTPTKDRIWSEK